MTAASKTPLADRRLKIAADVEPTPQQRDWIAALLALKGDDRVRTVNVERAVTSRYSLVVYANWGARRDHEYAVWTLSSAGTADIW